MPIFAVSSHKLQFLYPYNLWSYWTELQICTECSYIIGMPYFKINIAILQSFLKHEGVVANLAQYLVAMATSLE